MPRWTNSNGRAHWSGTTVLFPPLTALLAILAVGACHTGSFQPIEIDASRKTPGATSATPTMTPQAPSPTATRPVPTPMPVSRAESPSVSPPAASASASLASPTVSSSSGTTLEPPRANASGGYLYRATLAQAAPGRLLDLIDAYKAFFPALAAGGDEAPLWMRHSQGDRWDLLLLFPMESHAQFYRSERIARRRAQAPSSKAALARLRQEAAWQEDLFVEGPPIAELRARASKAGFFHVEMFEALAGRQADLLREREMENSYLNRLGRPENCIFVRESGAAWDLFTVGFYRDLKHYAESADIPEGAQEAAAKAAGFDSARTIGSYLRSFIRLHHDTLAVAVK